MQSGHGGTHFHGTSRSAENSRQLALFLGVRTQDEVVVYTSSGSEERIVDTVPDTCGLTEVHGRIRYRKNLAGRTCCVVERRVFVRQHLQDMVVDGTLAFAFEVEVSVVGKAHDGRFVRFGFVRNQESVLAGQRVSDVDIHIARVVLLTVSST